MNTPVFCGRFDARPLPLSSAACLCRSACSFVCLSPAEVSCLHGRLYHLRREAEFCFPAHDEAKSLSMFHTQCNTSPTLLWRAIFQSRIDSRAVMPARFIDDDVAIGYSSIKITASCRHAHLTAPSPTMFFISPKKWPVMTRSGSPLLIGVALEMALHFYIAMSLRYLLFSLILAA